jgi:hypothetical protein
LSRASHLTKKEKKNGASLQLWQSFAGGLEGRRRSRSVRSELGVLRRALFTSRSYAAHQCRSVALFDGVDDTFVQCDANI